MGQHLKSTGIFPSGLIRYFHFNNTRKVITPILSTEEGIEKLIAWMGDYWKDCPDHNLVDVQLWVPDGSGTLTVPGCEKCGYIHLPFEEQKAPIDKLIEAVEEKYIPSMQFIVRNIPIKQKYFEAAKHHFLIVDALKEISALCNELKVGLNFIPIWAAVIDYFQQDKDFFSLDFQEYKAIIASSNVAMLKLKKEIGLMDDIGGGGGKDDEQAKESTQQQPEKEVKADAIDKRTDDSTDSK